MDTVIYIWDSSKKKFGHASMELSDGTYISWWPRPEAHSLYTEVKLTDKGRPPVTKTVVVNPCKNMRMDTLPAVCFIKVRPILADSYIDDVELMGDKADHVVMLRKRLLDEDRVYHFWKKTKEVHQPYILGTNNCADMIFRALRIGGATAYVPDPGFAYIWTPRRLYNYVERFSFLAMVLNSNSRLGEYFEMNDMPRHKRKPIKQAYESS
ncbi:uncharacterized protein LOC134719833 [Mytilus trossulus]|uniref:uncharacterized protein LOC134719833 n=1 Tax=Mytilus trossulus TaxID=6551 RepID=UPI0030068D9A